MIDRNREPYEGEPHLTLTEAERNAYLTGRWKVNTPTVYVIQEDPKKNITQALDFGNVEKLLEPREEATMLNIPAITQKLRYGLRNMTPHDYLLLLGNPASIGIAFAIAADITGGRFNILKWDAQEMRYWKAAVDVREVR